MELINEQYQSIKNMYETMNVYRSMIVYSDEHSFTLLHDMLVKNDYPVRTSGHDCRMYCLKTPLEEEPPDIEWETISIVFALDDASFDNVKEVISRQKREEYSLIVKI